MNVESEEIVKVLQGTYVLCIVKSAKTNGDF